jgi:hypothetical protein
MTTLIARPERNAERVKNDPRLSFSDGGPSLQHARIPLGPLARNRGKPFLLRGLGAKPGFSLRKAVHLPLLEDFLLLTSLEARPTDFV